MTLISPWGLGMFDLEVFQCRIVWKEFTSLKYYKSTILRRAHASFVDSLFSPVSRYPNRGFLANVAESVTVTLFAPPDFQLAPPISSLTLILNM